MFIICLDVLAEKGPLLGEPVVHYLDGYIWELRPLKNKIIYAFFRHETFILLHCFLKLSELCGLTQPAIARLESAAHSPQISSILRILKPLGYRLAVVKSKAAGE